MSATDAVIRVKRVEEAHAVQFVAGNADSEAAIRGWMPSMPADVNIEDYIPDGTWILRRRKDQEIYFATPEQFAAEIQIVEEW